MKNKKNFWNFFFPFFESTLNFEHFQTKIALIAYVFPKLWTAKNVVRQMSKKSRLRLPVDKQHGKRAKTPIKSQQQHLYHNH